MRSIDLPPFAPILIQSTRAIGYSLEAAVADIIDNSIAAGATNISIGFYPLEDPYIAILDNGCGMDEAEINTAMQYGSISPLEERSKQDLGRFGLGLKTASLSQCRKLTVISKVYETVVARCWDIDYVAETKQWSLIALSKDEIQALPCVDKLMIQSTGTLVLWQNLDRLKMGETNFELSLSKRMAEVRKHLALVYHRYLIGETGIKKIAMDINNEPVVPFDPFLLKKSYQAMDDEVLTVHAQKVVIRPYILPHISKLTKEEIASLGGKEGIRRQQGFYIYRNKRLLAWGTWFRLMRQGDLSKLARIQVDLPNSLDDLWTLDIKKSTAIPPSELRQSLTAIIEKIAEKSKRTWIYRGKKEVSDDAVHIWNRFRTPNGDVFYQINRQHPAIENLIRRGVAPASLEAALKQIECGLPLNQMYVDLNNDEHFSNDNTVSESTVGTMLESMLSGCSPDEKRAMLGSLRFIEPFDAFPELLDSMI